MEEMCREAEFSLARTMQLDQNQKARKVQTPGGLKALCVGNWGGSLKTRAKDRPEGVKGRGQYGGIKGQGQDHIPGTLDDKGGPGKTVLPLRERGIQA